VTPDLFVPPGEPWLVTVETRVFAVEGVEPTRVSRTVRRRRADDGVSFTPVELDGRRGLLALPAGEPPSGGWPAVACFGGSEGGYESQIQHVGLLASHGFAALAVSWVEEVDGEVTIAKVPLERFAAPVRWLGARGEVDTDRVAGMAVSRGAEGLLAAACADPGLGLAGLVLVSPSSVTWQAVGSGGRAGGHAVVDPRRRAGAVGAAADRCPHAAVGSQRLAGGA
jgi:hypothetical protein